MNAPMILDSTGVPIRRNAHFGDTAWNAASGGREMADWNPSPGSADADYLAEREEITFRARDLERNEAQVGSGMNVTVENVVGTGLTCIPSPDWVALGKSKAWAEEWSRIVRSKWNAYANSTDCDVTGVDNFAGLTQQVLYSVLLNGEAVSIPLYLPDQGTTHWGTTHQIVESDRLSNPDGSMDTKHMRGGVEIDDRGRPLAYHISNEHPGEVGMIGWDRQWERIPATTAWGRKRVLHIFQRRRWGQSRGVSLLATIMPEFRTLNKMKQAELQSAFAQSLVSIISHTNAPYEQVVEMFNSPRDLFRARRQHVPKLGSGATIVAAPGEKIEAFSPSRSAINFDQFIKTCLRQAFAGMNLPYELGARDFGGMNYSSARAMLIEAWRGFDTKRYWLADRWAQPSYELWFEEEVGNGGIPDCTTDDLLDVPGAWQAWMRCEWLGPARGSVDPEKDAKAQGQRFANGTTTLQIECAEQGYDWRDMLEQQAYEREVHALKGVRYPGDAPPPAANSQQPSEEASA